MGYTHHHDTARLLKAFTRTVEPRNFGIGLVAGFLLITCAYFSTARFDAIHIAPLVSPSETRIGSPATAATAGSKSQFDLGVPGHDAALSMEGSKAKVLDTNPFTTPAPQMAPRHYMMM